MMVLGLQNAQLPSPCSSCLMCCTLLLCVPCVLQGAPSGKALHKTNSQAAVEGWSRLPERLFNMHSNAGQHTGYRLPASSANPCSGTNEGQQTWPREGGKAGWAPAWKPISCEPMSLSSLTLRDHRTTQSPLCFDDINPYKLSTCSFFFNVLCGFMKTPDVAEG